MSDEPWTTEEIRKAFRRAFHESGEVWFDYLGTPEEREASTDEHWESLSFHLRRVTAKAAGIDPLALAKLKAELAEAEANGDIIHRKATEIAASREEIDRFNAATGLNSGDCLLIEQMRENGLKDPQIRAALLAIRNTCPRCWNAWAGCRC